MQLYCHYDSYGPYGPFIDKVFFYIDLAVFSLVPALTIMFCNICIIKSAMEAHRRRKDLSGTELHAESSSMRQMNITLISVSVAALCTTLPFEIYQVITINDFVTLDSDLYYNTFASLNLLLHCNNAINIFLYCIRGPVFRRNLKRLFKCRYVTCLQ